MDFRFDEDQLALRDGVRAFLDDQCTLDHVARAWEHGADATRWKALAAMGVVGLLAPEDAGGMGMTEVELALVLEEAGRAGLPEPLAEVAAVTVPLLAASGDVERLARVTAGDLVVVPALAIDPFPAHVPAADAVLLEAGGALRLVARDELTWTDRPNVDHARPTVALGDPGTSGDVLDVPREAIAAGAARGAWAAAAVLCGTARRLLDLATEYAIQREQFGVPIGSFQAVKHHLATALVDVEFARPLVHRAAWSLATAADEAALHASMAKAAAGEAAQAAARAALQVHGAIGYTWEHPLHLLLKRVWSLSGAWGTDEEHWQVVEASVLP